MSKIAIEEMFGPKYAPHSPTLKSTYWEKVQNTYYVLFGKVSVKNQTFLKTLHPKKWTISFKKRDGLFDVFPFFAVDHLLSIARLFLWVLLEDVTDGVKLSNLFAPPLGILFAATIAATFALRVSLALVSLAITAVAAVTILPVMQVITGLIWDSYMRGASKLTFEHFGEAAMIEAFNNQNVDTNATDITNRNSTSIILSTTCVQDNEKFRIVVPIQEALARKSDTAKALGNLIAVDYDGLASAIEEREKPKGIRVR